MLDFKELPQDGEAFEQLIRELLFSYGMTVEWSGRGPDGGRDLICRESLKSLIAPTNRTWLVQCKHFAHANFSVGVDDLRQHCRLARPPQCHGLPARVLDATLFGRREPA
jgi:hypothetical protein